MITKFIFVVALIMPNGECFSEHMSVSYLDALLGDFQVGCGSLYRLLFGGFSDGYARMV